jgi:type I restriction enzyme S subunit
MTSRSIRLDEAAELVLGKMLDKAKNRGEPMPYLANINVRWGEFDLDDLRTMRFQSSELDRYGLRSGDIIMCEGGEPGRCAIWRDQVPGTMIQKALHRIRPRPGIDASFLYYQLSLLGRTGGLEPYFTGSTIKHLPREQLAKVEVWIPLPDEQARIASILGAYDDLIEVNRRRVAVLEEMARGLFEEWFVRFRFPGHEGVPMVNSAHGPLPEGWRWGCLGDVLEQRRDSTSPGPHLTGRIYVPIECIGRKTLALTAVLRWEEAQTSLQLFEAGDVLFGAMRAYFHKVAPAPDPGVTRSTCFVLRPRKAHYFAFSTIAVFQDEAVAYAATHSKGSTIPYAHWENSLERFAVALPTEDHLRRFEDVVGPMIQLILASSRAMNALSAARDHLLPRLISGELSVAAAEREVEAMV